MHYFVVANLPKEHDELFLALMHNRLINVVSTSVVTTSRTLSTGKLSAQGVKGEEPKIVAYCLQNIPGNVDPTPFKADCAKYVQSREHDGIDEHYEGNKNMKWRTSMI